MVETFYEVEDRHSLLTNVRAALKPSGRLGIVEYRTDGGGPGPPLEQRLPPTQVIRSAETAGFRFVRQEQFLPVSVPADLHALTVRSHAGAHSPPRVRWAHVNMTRWRIVAVVCLLLAAGGMAAVMLRTSPPPQPQRTEPASRPGDQAIRDRIYAELQPVRLTGCTLKRIGEAHDGGYVMCANLLDAEAGYSYGISNYDGWGCGISTGLGVPVHQYDCFDQRAPRCDGGQTQFHAECIAASSSVDAKAGDSIRLPARSPATAMRRDGWS